MTTNPKSFDERESEARATATEGMPSNTREEREARSRAAQKAACEWFKTLPLYDSIEIRRRDNSCIEIEDRYFGGSISVYPPRPDWDFSGDERKKRIVPGYVNASSWQAGRNGSDCAFVKQEMQHRLKMMEMALNFLNEVNSIVLDWESLENPFEMTTWKEEELKRYRDNERQRIAADARKATERAERRKNR